MSQQTPALIVEPWGKKSTSRTPFLFQNTVHKIFRVEVVRLNSIFVGDEACLHCMNCCLNSGVSRDTHVSSPVTTWLKKFSPSTPYSVRKSNVLARRLNLCSSINIFGTQFAHNFRNLNLSDNSVKWPRNLRKCREWRNDETSVLSKLFNCTHQILNHQTVGRSADYAHFCVFIKQLHLSTYPFNYSRHVLRSSQNWRWISPGFMFFAFKKRITDRSSHAVRFSIFLNIINTQHDA